MNVSTKIYYHIMKKEKNQKIKDLLGRGVNEIVVASHLKKYLAFGEKLRIKFGIDPSGVDVHLGHCIPLRKLQAFAELGHTPVLIIGDWTAMIGDPSGKDKTRPPLSKEQVRKNAETYLGQIGKILDLKKTEAHYQSEWFDDFGLDKIIHLASKMTFGQIMAHETFRKRSLGGGSGLSMHELLYPLLQGYDSVMVRADVELGATEQKFNLLVGREIQKAYGQEPQDILIVQYLTGTDGKEKMGKSLNNYIALGASADDMYGKVMSIPDSLIKEYADLLTDLVWDELKKLPPRDAKAKVAAKVVEWIYDEQKAAGAAENFKNIFCDKGVPKDIPEFKLKGEASFINILVSSGLVSSRSEARRLIVQDGIRVNGAVVASEKEAPKLKGGDILQVGKRRFARASQ